MKTAFVRRGKPCMHIPARDIFVIAVAAAASWITLLALGYAAFHVLCKLF